MSALSRAQQHLENAYPASQVVREPTFTELKQQKDEYEKRMLEQAERIATELAKARDTINEQRLLIATSERSAAFYKQEFEKQQAVNRKLAAYVMKIDTRLNVINDTIDAVQREAKDFNLQEVLKQLTDVDEKREENVDQDVAEVVKGIVRVNPREGDQKEEHRTTPPQNEYVGEPEGKERRPINAAIEPPIRLGPGGRIIG